MRDAWITLARSEQGLQLRGIRPFVANGADRDNPQRRRIDGRACAH
jgi:hypothetical protein